MTTTFPKDFTRQIWLFFVLCWAMYTFPTIILVSQPQRGWHRQVDLPICCACWKVSLAFRFISQRKRHILYLKLRCLFVLLLWNLWQHTLQYVGDERKQWLQRNHFAYPFETSPNVLSSFHMLRNICYYRALLFYRAIFFAQSSSLVEARVFLVPAILRELSPVSIAIIWPIGREYRMGSSNGNTFPSPLRSHTSN